MAGKSVVGLLTDGGNHKENKGMGNVYIGSVMKSKHAQKIQFLCLLFFLTGCSSQPASTPSIATPSKTLPLSTSTNVAVSSPITINEPNSTQKCLQFFQSPDNLIGNNYGIILFDRDSTTDVRYNKLKNPYLYTLGTNKRESIIGGTNFAVSNDRSLFAYRVIDKNELIISDNKGKTLTASFTQPIGIEGWVNDGLLLYNFNNAEILFLNPFNNERKNLQENFPNRYSLHYTWMEGVYEKVYYDPSLTKAFYFAKDSQINSYYFSMWDVSTNKEIVRLPQMGFADSFPAEWALDGKQIIIYVSSTNGKQTVLLSIHTDGTIETLLSNANDSPRFALSPNSKNLAFWSYDNIQKNWSLSVLDMESKGITDYCVKSKYFPEMPPLWSPDSQNLVVYMVSDDSENTKAILIDRKQNFAVQIAENAQPAGWLK